MRAVLNHVAGHDEQQVASETADRVLHEVLRALANGHHGDHGADADDDAQRGEDRAHLVSHERAESDFKNGPEIHNSSSFSAAMAGKVFSTSEAMLRSVTRSSELIRPS